MKIQTVRGNVVPDQLGITLPHEHLYVDLAEQVIGPPIDPYMREIAAKPVDCSVVGDLLRNPMISADSLRLLDVDVAISELNYFKAAGGKSLVDQTSKWSKGDPRILQKISKTTGINIIAASAYYDTPIEYLESRSIDQLADELVREVTEGFDGTDIKAGIIGEIHTTWPLKSFEEKQLRAAARAQVRTGAPLSIHPSCWDKEALTLIDIAESEGVNPQRIMICHLDHVMDYEYHKAVASRGVYVEYDRCGIERYGGDFERRMKLFPRDPERITGILELIAGGYLNQILLSHDVCMKIELKRYAGPGYGHILRYIVPMLRQRGVSDTEINTILVSNPARMLTF